MKKIVAELKKKGFYEEATQIEKVIAKGWETLPKGWTKQSAIKYWNNLTGDVTHKITKCIRKMEDEGITDAGVFCASLARFVGYKMGFIEGSKFTFKSMEDVNSWIAKKAKEYGGKNRFYSSEEYKKAYPKIKKIYDKEKKEYYKRKKELIIEKNPTGKGFALKRKHEKNRYIVPIGDPFMGISDKYCYKSKKEAEEYAKKI